MDHSLVPDQNAAKPRTNGESVSTTPRSSGTKRRWPRVVRDIRQTRMATSVSDRSTRPWIDASEPLIATPCRLRHGPLGCQSVVHTISQGVSGSLRISHDLSGSLTVAHGLSRSQVPPDWIHGRTRWTPRSCGATESTTTTQVQIQIRHGKRQLTDHSYIYTAAK